VNHLQLLAHAGSSLADFYTLKKEAIRSSETSVHTRIARRHTPENGILQGSTFLRDTGELLPDYTASHPKKTMDQSLTLESETQHLNDTVQMLANDFFFISELSLE
jgi:hypothetical protein